MSVLITSFAILAGQNPFLAYFIVYVATIFLGNISAFTSFWIVLRSDLSDSNIPLLILVIFLANVSGDLLWYTLGKYLRDTRFGNWIRNRIPGHERIERSLQHSGRKWMFLAKFFYASSFPVIFSIGWSKMAFKRFFKNSLLATCMWLPILLGLAYGLISGLSPLAAATAFQNVEWFFFIGLALFIVLDYLLAKLARALFEKKNGNGDGDLWDIVEPEL